MSVQTSAPAVSGAADDTGGLSIVQKTERVMACIKGFNKFTLGDFLKTLLSSSEQFVDVSHQQMLTQWLSANTRDGSRPAEIVDLIYRHPQSLKHQNNQPKMATYQELVLPQIPSAARSHRALSFLPAAPPKGEKVDRSLYNSREGLEEWSARAVMHRVNLEANILESELARAGNPTWKKLEGFSLASEKALMKAKAPVIWATLSAIGSAQKRKDKATQSSSTGSDSDSDSDTESEWENVEPGAERKFRRKKQADESSELVGCIYMFECIDLMAF
jgi:hypothetical protein